MTWKRSISASAVTVAMKYLLTYLLTAYSIFAAKGSLQNFHASPKILTPVTDFGFKWVLELVKGLDITSGTCQPK